LTEFLIGVIGPVTSLAVGVVCLTVASAAGWQLGGGADSLAAAVLGWLGSINVLLALFNLIPGYPLDGGRVLKAALWWRFQDADRATRTAARVGQVVAGAFIALGLFQFSAGFGAGGLWLAFIGWFLLMAAEPSDEHVTIASVLRGVRVGDLMAQECSRVDPGTSVQSIVDEVWLRTARRCVVVQSDGHVLGVVTPHEVRPIDRAQWPAVTANEVMTRLPDLQTVEPDTSAADALQAMARHDVNQLPVVSDGRLEGMVSRGQLLQLIQSHKERRA
jgi:CBS domain-containing protein